MCGNLFLTVCDSIDFENFLAYLLGILKRFDDMWKEHDLIYFHSYTQRNIIFLLFEVLRKTHPI